jgi:PAS domain S-box-containing protein
VQQEKGTGSAMNDPQPRNGFTREIAFQHGPDAVVVMDANGRVLAWNPAAERIFGYPREEAVGREVAELIIPGPLRDAHRNRLARYLETGESAILGRRVELSAQRADGTTFPVELVITRVEDRPVTFMAFVHDLAVRHAVRQESARLQQRMAFLAQAGLALDRTLELRDTLRTLAELAVPELADLAVVDMVDPDGSIRLAVAAAPDSEHARAVEAIREGHPLLAGGTHPVSRVVRGGRAMLLRQMSPMFQREIAQGDEHYELMRRLSYYSAIVVPLVARQRTLGALSLLRMEGSRAYDEDDLVLAEELARRAALAVANARLFESTREFARTLQESLLPRTLPQIPGVTLSARYLAAEQGQEVGGDFYDAFAIAGNRWGIAIGDVCGKGPQAAAVTALARYTIRALAHRGPGTVLRLLNEAIMRNYETLPERFLTAVFAVAWREGPMLAFEVASGGHPAPFLLRADGTVEQLALRGMLLGVSAGVRYRTQRVVLAPGEAMVLYTDGLTDARAPERILSEDDLATILAGAGSKHRERLAEYIEEQATGGLEPRDDIAVLVVENAGGEPQSSDPPLASAAYSVSSARL